MPSPNTLKTYQADHYYHLYNRGVNKRKIFLDDQDYKVFLSYLKEYLSPVIDGMFPSKIKNNFNKVIKLSAYCLMPNHFHLLVHQKNPDDINYFMRSLNTNYVRYFNLRHRRIGPLYQSRYKAVSVTTDEQLLYLSKYIHRNPLKSLFPEGNPTSRTVLEVMVAHKFSSLSNYLGAINQPWVNTSAILTYFSHINSSQLYAGFITNQELSDTINPLLLDE
ncbi:hypothetical protein A3B57_01930 [Microgenomates group bacterium RIFCSPLOWO2_01_FULL_47_10]|nr:MAG: hypothetical protein A3B57_01930 [Microgenomates group bacterium RIFCSPLOWO2_01_FULL_47_10]